MGLTVWQHIDVVRDNLMKQGNKKKNKRTLYVTPRIAVRWHMQTPADFHHTQNLFLMDVNTSVLFASTNETNAAGTIQRQC
jgi:hypothetical protein